MCIMCVCVCVCVHIYYIYIHTCMRVCMRERERESRCIYDGVMSNRFRFVSRSHTPSLSLSLSVSLYDGWRYFEDTHSARSLSHSLSLWLSLSLSLSLTLSLSLSLSLSQWADFSETHSALKFGARARSIKNIVKVNRNLRP